MARLVAAGGFSTDLGSGKVTLGEGPGADISFPQGLNLAPIHAELRPLLGGFVLKHLADSFETSVNGNSITSLRNLSGGDIIRIGELELTFIIDPEKHTPEEEATQEGATLVVSEEPTAVEEPIQAPPPQPVPVAEIPEAQALPPMSAHLTETPPPTYEEARPLPQNPRNQELPPLPAHLAETPPNPGAEVLPPLPVHLAETPPSPGAEALPPLPVHLAETPPNPGAEALPPLPTNLAEPPPNPGAEALPPLPTNLAEPPPNPGAEALPPLPTNLAEPPPNPGAEALPPLPTNLAEPPSASVPGAADLPPLPDNLAAAQPIPGAPEMPALSHDMAPVQPAATGPDMPLIESEESAADDHNVNVPAVWDSSQDEFDTPGTENVTLKLKTPPRSTATNRKKPLFSEIAIPGVVTLVVAGIAIIFLLQHNHKLAESYPASPTGANGAEGEDEELPPTQVITPFTLALEKLKTEVKRPRRHEFPAENFIFNSPGQDWTPSFSIELPGAQVRMTYQDDRCRFAIIGEPLGSAVAHTDEDLKEIVKNRLMLFTPHLQFIEKDKHTNKGLTFTRLDARARVKGERHYLVNNSLYLNGFFYQLITDGSGHEEVFVQEKAQEMLKYFDLIDRQRDIALKEDYSLENFRSAYDGYQISLNKRFWDPWKMREFKFPGAQIAATSTQRSIFGVMPMHFKEDIPNLDDLTAAFLATFDIPFPAEGQEVEDLKLNVGEGRQIIHAEVINNRRKTYHLQVITRGRTAYMLGGWAPGSSDYTLRDIRKAIKEVILTNPNPSAPQRRLTYGQRRGQSIILHQLGIQKLYAQEPDLALKYFKKSVANNPGYYEVYDQLVDSFDATGREVEGLAFLEELYARRNDAKLQSAIALMHCKAGDVSEGIRLFESVSARDGYHDRDQFISFIMALAKEGQYDEANAFIGKVGAKESPAILSLFEAMLLNRKGDHEGSLALLQPLVATLPGDPLMLTELVLAHSGLKQPEEAYALASKVETDRSPDLAAFLRGKCHVVFGEYKNAKTCFEEANRLAPFNRSYRSALVKVSALMQDPPLNASGVTEPQSDPESLSADKEPPSISSIDGEE